MKREDGTYGCNMASLGEVITSIRFKIDLINHCNICLQGLLGKLQIRRSGACQLLLGEDQVVQCDEWKG